LHLVGTAALADGGTLVRRPVLSLSFALNAVLLGPEPRAFHAVNLAIHLGAGLLLFGIVRRTPARVRESAVAGSRDVAVAFAVAVLWLVHPLQTEAVTYVIQRAESLMGFFYLLALYCAVRGAGSPRPLAWYGGAVAACALGMGTKEVMATAPLMVLLYDGLFLSPSLAAALRRRWGLYLALAATWAIPAVLMALTLDDVRIDFREGRTWPYALAQPRVILHYLRLALWPRPLHMYVNTDRFTVYPGITPWLDLALPAAGVGLLLIGSLWALARRHWLGFAGVWFFLILAPTSSVVATNDVIQEHRMYLPLAAVVSLGVCAGAAALQRLASAARLAPPVQTAAVAVAVGMVTVLLISLTRTRNWDYHDEMAVYHPDDRPIARLILGRHAYATGRVDEAEALYRAAVQVPPSRAGQLARPRFHLGMVHNDLGALLAGRGDLAGARVQLERALALDEKFPPALNNLGVVDAMQDRPRDAERHLERAVALDGALVQAHGNLALVLAQMGRVDDAVAVLKEALTRWPAYEVGRKHLAYLTAHSDPPAITLGVRAAPTYDDARLELVPAR
jgi:hypothetical protein